jgi:hypothetical protein
LSKGITTVAKYISSFDLAHYAGLSHEELHDLLIDSELGEANSKITQDEYELIKDCFDTSSQSKISTFFGVQTDVKFQFDLLGGVTEIKPRKPKTKVIPERTWEADDYLPNLEESKNYEYKFFKDISQPQDEELIFDIEVYGNYFLIMFLGYRTGRCWYFEKTEGAELDVQGIRWFIENHTLISFNGIKFDLPLLAIALNNADFDDLWKATEMLINDENGLRPYQIVKQFKAKQLDCDHIDLIEVAPLKGSLKLYGARLHTPNLQDLPFKPGINLSQDQIDIVRRYCLNDVETTAYLYNKLIPQIELRKDIGKQYKLDVRSKSDAQIAESVIKSECESFMGRKIYPDKDNEISHVTYDVPSFIKFKRKDLNDILLQIKQAKFHIEKGYLQAGFMENITVNIAGSDTAMSIGGIHSCEKSISHYADDEYEIVDADCTSFYPSIIITQKLVPELLGNTFLKVYSSAKDKRVVAKKNGDKVTDATYKILLNSSFGKFGNKFSILYAPKLLLQTTLTGQLSLMMLAERFEECKFMILQQNTDGLCIKLKRSDSELLKSVVEQWEHETQFNMEYVYYKSIHSRDVNNYCSVKSEGGIKRKGAYSEESLSKNPQNNVCADAAVNYLLTKESVESYIKSCNDIRKFLTVRNVTGGAIKDGGYLGKTVRFYHSNSTSSALHYAKSGNTVPTSEGCRPMMKITKQFPIDVDHNWYITEAISILKDMGVKYEQN